MGQPVQKTPDWLALSAKDIYLLDGCEANSQYWAERTETEMDAALDHYFKMAEDASAKYAKFWKRVSIARDIVIEVLAVWIGYNWFSTNELGLELILKTIGIPAVAVLLVLIGKRFFQYIDQAGQTLAVQLFRPIGKDNRMESFVLALARDNEAANQYLQVINTANRQIRYVDVQVLLKIISPQQKITVEEVPPANS